MIKAVEEVFPRHVAWFVENVFSMGTEARAQFTDVLGVTPLLLDAKSFARVRRPRLFWCSWDACAHMGTETSITCKGVGREAYYKVEPAPCRAAADAWPLEGCSLRDPEVDLPCFTRPIVRRHPPLRPVGLERATPEARRRWAADGYRYQVCNYEDGCLLWDAEGARGRLAGPEERGVLMGFDRRYLEAAVKDSVPQEERNIIMEGLVGNAFNVQTVVFLFGSWLARVGALSAPVSPELRIAIGERGPN